MCSLAANSDCQGHHCSRRADQASSIADSGIVQAVTLYSLTRGYRSYFLFSNSCFLGNIHTNPRVGNPGHTCYDENAIFLARL